MGFANSHFQNKDHGGPGKWNADHSRFEFPDGQYLTQGDYDIATTQGQVGDWKDGDNASGDPFKTASGPKQLGDDLGSEATNLGTGFGFVPKQIDPNAPGASLDATNADNERNRLGKLLAQLQQQAATGGGSWENTLKAGTDSANSAATSLGQSMQGVGYADALHNIGNAQAGNNQRAVGQGNILRAQSKLGAQRGVDELLAGQGEQDINQADAASKVAQGQRELQSQLNQQANKNVTDTASKVGQAVAMASDGGKVPGQPQVFGDNEKNDTVPAMLSPGEIVIPRSHASSPEAAADFVRALHASRGVQRFAGGGETAPQNTSISGNSAPNSGLTNTGSVGQDFMSEGQEASIKNGGLLDTTAFDQTRAAHNTNADLLYQQAAGDGPSVAGQQMANASDANIAAAMRVLAGHRGMGHGNLLSTAAEQVQGGAGAAAATAGGEQQQGQESALRSSLRQRQLELAMASARQQAAWRNTQLNAGLSLEQQSNLRNVVGAGGQAATAFSTADEGGASPKGGGFGGSDKNTPSFDEGFGRGNNGASSDPSEWDNPYGGYAKGGRVEVTPGEPTGMRHLGDSVEVELKDPTNLVWTHEMPSAKAKALATVVKLHDMKNNDYIDRDSEYTPQFAHGGEVSESERARAFVAALKRRRA